MCGAAFLWADGRQRRPSVAICPQKAAMHTSLSHYNAKYQITRHSRIGMMEHAKNMQRVIDDPLQFTVYVTLHTVYTYSTLNHIFYPNFFYAQNTLFSCPDKNRRNGICYNVQLIVNLLQVPIIAINQRIND